MSRFSELLLAGCLIAATAGASATSGFPGVGRAATPAEVKAWDIDVRPDFKGLPPGKGSVDQGIELWEAKCTACHGSFGESNEVFTPLVGGTTKEDIETGRVGAYIRQDAPQRSTLMKVPTLSTLWDYINRAMPWNAPKSLSPDEVYAVLAYLLHLGEIVPADFTLSDKNIADVQKRMPNRNGMTTRHGMWDIKGKPDVKNVACMKNCKTQITLGSSLPDYARDAHGNLADQNRVVGAVRGQQTSDGGGAAAPTPHPALELMKKSGCSGCHGIAGKVFGPSFRDIAKRYKDDKEAESQLIGRVKAGGGGRWGDVGMPPQAHVSDADTAALIKWILSGSPEN